MASVGCPINEFIYIPSPQTTLSSSQRPPNITRDEIVDFLEGLTVERHTFITSTDRVLQSDDLMVMKKDGRVVAIVGVKRLWGAPLVYLIVSATYRGMGYGYRLSQAGWPQARRLYPFLLAIISNNNPVAIRLAKGLGFYPCLMTYKCHFLFLPLSWWGYVFYPLYAVFFPPWYWGYFFCKKHRLF